MEADTTVSYRTRAETTETPKLPPPLQRKPESGRSVLRPKRKFMHSPLEETNQSNQANDHINALVPAIVNAIQAAVQIAKKSSPHKETPFPVENGSD